MNFQISESQRKTKARSIIATLLESLQSNHILLVPYFFHCKQFFSDPKSGGNVDHLDRMDLSLSLNTDHSLLWSGALPTIAEAALLKKQNKNKNKTMEQK